jgi:hypothetical protein
MTDALLFLGIFQEIAEPASGPMPRLVCKYADISNNGTAYIGRTPKPCA